MKKAKDQSESEPAELASLVGERIRKIRKEERLSLELFALRCDMNAAYVGHIERGVQNPALNTLERICKGLDISVEDPFIDKSTTVDFRQIFNRVVTFSQFLRNELGCHRTGIISTNTICNRYKALCALTFMYAHRQNVLIQNHPVLILNFLFAFFGLLHRFSSFHLRNISTPAAEHPLGSHQFAELHSQKSHGQTDSVPAD